MGEISKIFENVFNIHDENCLSEVEGEAKLRDYKKGEIAVMQGETPTHIPFIVKGSFWGYSIDGSGSCFTDCITDFYGCPVTAVSEPENFLKPSEVSFEALEDSSAVLVPVSIILRIVMAYPEAAEAMNRIILIGFQYHRNFQYMNSLPIYKRYMTFCELYPELSARLNKSSIAACLNVSLPALSRALSDAAHT